MTNIIKSKESKLYKKIIKLHTKKNRDSENEYLIEGENLVLDSFAKDKVIFLGFSQQYFEELSQSQKEFLLSKKINYAVFENKLFKNMAETETPQGILGILRKNNLGEKEFFLEKNKKIIVLDRLQDPGNVGTILRTAKATGHSLIFLKGTVDPYSSKVVRSAMGAVGEVSMLFLEDEKELVCLLKKRNFKIIGTDVKGGTPFHYVDYKGKNAVIVSNESTGTDEALLNKVDTKVYIPMEKGIESLNVAVAASVIMYKSYLDC